MQLSFPGCFKICSPGRPFPFSCAILPCRLPDAAFQEQALLALYRYGKRDKNKAQLMQLGGGKAVISALEHHYNSNKVSYAACCVIRHLRGNLYAFNKEGAGIRIIRAMQDFPEDAALQAAACYALRTIISCVYNADVLVSYKVLPLLASAMRKFPNWEEVQKAAVGAVWGFGGSESDKTQKEMWDAHLPFFVIQAMVKHPKAEKVQEYGVGALRCFKLVYSTVRLGGAVVCVRAMQNNPRNNRLAELCMKTMKEFSMLPSNVEVFLKLEAPKQIVECLVQHHSSLSLQESGISVVWCMAEFPQLRKAFIKERIGHAFHQLFKNHSAGGRSRTSLMIKTLLLITRFSMNEISVRHFLTLNLVSTIVEVSQKELQQKTPSLLLIERTIDVLSSFCRALPEASQPIAAEVTSLLGYIEGLKASTHEAQNLTAKARKLRELL